MIDFDVAMVRLTLVKAVRLITSVRMFLKPLGKDYPEVGELEREFREAAGEMQRVEKVMQAETKWPKEKVF